MGARGGGVVACAAAAALAGLLGACTPPPSPPPATASGGSGGPVVPSTSWSRAPSGATPGLDDGGTGTPSPASTLTLDDGSIRSAVTEAGTVMRLFGRPKVPAGRWWRELEPHLSTRAAQDYRGTDPATVSFRTITGRPTFLPDSTPLVARVSVPTEEGVYLVILSRTDARPRWLTERLLPPEGPGD